MLTQDRVHQQIQDDIQRSSKLATTHANLYTYQRDIQDDVKTNTSETSNNKTQLENSLNNNPTPMCNKQNPETVKTKPTKITSDPVRKSSRVSKPPDRLMYK